MDLNWFLLEKNMDGFEFFFWRKAWMDLNGFFGEKHGWI